LGYFTYEERRGRESNPRAILALKPVTFYYKKEIDPKRNGVQSVLLLRNHPLVGKHLAIIRSKQRGTGHLCEFRGKRYVVLGSGADSIL
jgi:hypothetical protein